MKRFLKFLLLIILGFSFNNLAIGQPPPDVPPELIDTYGEIDVTFDENLEFTWKTINNTQCSIEFSNWFKVNLNGSPSVDQRLDYVVGPGAVSTITNTQLLSIWYPSGGVTGTISALALWVKFGGMSGYQAIYPTMSGSKIHISGNSSPCDCFYVYFDFSISGEATIRFEPIVAPDTCP
jgi:hypothetical protein